MATTIQIRENLRDELDRLKGHTNKTYEEVILELMKTAEQSKRKQKAALIEGYKELAKESLKTTKEWEAGDLAW